MHEVEAGEERVASHKEVNEDLKANLKEVKRNVEVLLLLPTQKKKKYLLYCHLLPSPRGQHASCQEKS